MEEEEKKTNQETSEEEEEEIADLDAGLKEEDIQGVKDAVSDKVKKNHVLNPGQQRIFEEILSAAKMPVKMDNKDFKLGENELDIRWLSKQNRDQIIFRMSVLENVYLKQILTSLIDISRLLMVIADKIGVEDIIGKTDEVIEKVEKEQQIRETLGKKDSKDEDKKN